MGLPPRLMSIDEALVLFTLFFLIFILFCFFLAFFSQIKRISPDRLTTVQTWAVPQYIHTVYYGLNLHVMTEVLLQPPLQTLMHSSMWLHFHRFFSYFILFFVVAVFSQGGRISHDRLTTVQSWTVLLQIMG